MNATERARISDAYYSGTTTKREVCDAAALLREENENLRAENDRLRQQTELCVKTKAENAKLRELVLDLYCLAYPSTVEWEVSDETYNKYSPCEKCHELYGGKSPCASTAHDMTEECCAPIQANVVADRIRELGIEGA